MHIYGINRFFTDLPKFEKIFNDFVINRPIERVILADHTGLPFINLDVNTSNSAVNINKLNHLLNYHLRLFRQLEDNKMPISEMRGHSDTYRAYYYKFQAKPTTSKIQSVETMVDENIYANIDTNDTEPKHNLVNYYMILFSPMQAPTIDRKDFLGLIDELTKLINSIKIN